MPGRPAEPKPEVLALGPHRLAIRQLRNQAAGAASVGPILLFLHEGLGSIGQWRDVPDALAEATGLPALVYDRIGHGASSRLEGKRPPDFMQREAWETLPLLLDRLGISQVVPIGHSDGGTIALFFAAAFPERVPGVVTEAAHVFVEEETLTGIRKAVEAFETGDLKPRLQRYHGENTETMFRGWADVWLSAGFRGFSALASLPKIACPALVLQGVEDEYGTKAQVEAIRSGIAGPVEAHLIANCGHAPHAQARASVLPLIADFVRRVVDG
ncbi:MAG: alpha/beta hydrolase [Proteobacteria bacterium]|nr:alpha/beta hydrolase [Pseudomonadota bacterium]MBI3499581.1 alpha/beta hydrolase [Pseudomonadota bacterium]